MTIGIIGTAWIILSIIEWLSSFVGNAMGWIILSIIERLSSFGGENVLQPLNNGHNGRVILSIIERLSSFRSENVLPVYGLVHHKVFFTQVSFIGGATAVIYMLKGSL